MNFSLSRVLVTGGAGFIGSHLVDTLVAKGCDVVVLDDLSSGSLSNLEHVKDRITFYKGDIQDQKLLMEAAKNCEVIFHQAAMVSVTKTVDNPVDSAFINDMGTLIVLDAGRKNKVKRVVLASSSAVYGDDPLLPKHENMPLKPMSPYAVQKLTGELYARIYHDLYGIETVCLRYFNVYGPRQDPSSPYSGVISIFMTKAVSKKPPVIYGDGKQYRDFVFVKDVVKANLLAATEDDAAGQIFNIGTGKHVSINNLWDMISLFSGLKIEPEYIPSRPGDIIESVASIEQAKSALGFEPDYLFEKGLEITFKWYKDS
ncbi:MAG: SDR family oxidoreductase, partial [Methanosarcinales archaeon]|nr:SDR family oxidoreductase [Methanosarcinales archaeon]